MTSTPVNLILMAGLPGSGKSTVALALGGEFGYPVLDKDVILSALIDRVPGSGESHATAYEVLFALAENMVVRQRRSVIVDSPCAFDNVVSWAEAIAAASDARLIPVLCFADGRVRFERMRAREGLRSHSRGTVPTPGTGRERFGHLPSDTIAIDTEGPRDRVIATAVERVRARIATGRSPG